MTEKLIAAPTHDEIATYRDTFRRELDKRMDTRHSRLCRVRFFFDDFVGMFGMTEMESGIADIVNKAKDDGCLLPDVHFAPEDLTSDSDAFRELLAHGWLVESHGKYRLDAEAVSRVHKRFPNV